MRKNKNVHAMMTVESMAKIEDFHYPRAAKVTKNLMLSGSPLATLHSKRQAAQTQEMQGLSRYGVGDARYPGKSTDAEPGQNRENFFGVYFVIMNLFNSECDDLQ